MTEINVDIVLKDRNTRSAFTYDLSNNHNALNIKSYEYLPTIVSATIDDSKILDLINDSRCETVDEIREPFEPVLPPELSQTKSITTSNPSTSNRGQDYMGLQFYLDNDQNNQSYTVGVSPKDDTRSINNITYTSRWIGRNIDIVTIEASTACDPSNVNVHNTHPDFIGGRFIPMDWSGTTNSGNFQVSANNMFANHASGVLSAAAGNICGYAKGSTCRASYGGIEIPAVINAIIGFHQNKSINSNTGLKNPTIVIGEFQYLTDRIYGVPIDSVNKISNNGVEYTRPGNSWGSDYSKFIELNIIPFCVQDPDTSNYNWCVVVPEQSRYGTIFSSIKSMYDAGIIFICAAANNGGVIKKNANNLTSSSMQETNVYVDAYHTQYKLKANSSYDIYKTTVPYQRNYDAFNPYGPAGSIYGIDVAAGRNSESHPGLDGYTTRGPAIDIVGLGAQTWTAYQYGSTYTDGKWGHFSGTSCATPTVVGKVACYMEEFQYYNDRYPTFEEIKSWLQSNGRDIVVGMSSVNWSNVPAASTVGSNVYLSEAGPVLKAARYASTNGTLQFTELAGTTRTRCHFHTTDDPTGTYSTTKRPASGLMFPRQKIKQTINYEVDDYPNTY